MLVAYGKKRTIDVFRISKEGVQMIASGGLEGLKPFRLPGKKVLIIGRDLYLHLRKRYPPVGSNDLKKIISLEIDDLFPIKNSAHAYRVFEQTSSYTLVDIWAWERSFQEEIVSVFPYTHVVPEEALFVSDEPEIGIRFEDGCSHIVATSPQGYMGSTVIKGNVNPDTVGLFLKSLGKAHDAFSRLVFFDVPDPQILSSLKTLPLDVIVRDVKYPPCIDSLPRAQLKSYAVGGPGVLNILPVVMRCMILLLIGISISLAVTGRNYDRAVIELRKKITKLAGDMAALTTGPKTEDQKDIVKDLQKKLGEGLKPLAVMDMLAGLLPEKASVTRIVINEKNVEVAMAAEDPLGFIREVGKSTLVKSVKLRGSPTKEQVKGVPQTSQDQSKGRYAFTLTVEFK